MRYTERMLVFSDADLVYLAVPKTGSTAVEAALRPHASLCFAKSFKHTTAQRFKNRVAPFLTNKLGLTFETCAVIRDPLDHLRSWYRYRNRADVSCAKHSAKGIAFDDFVRASLLDVPPAYAAVGSQFRFLSNARGKVIVDHLFSYDALDRFQDFMALRLGTTFALSAMNVSPPIDTPLSADVETELRHARAADFALYQEVQTAGGSLRAPMTMAA